MAFTNLNKLFYLKYEVELFKIERQSNIKNIISKDYILKSFKDELNPNGDTFTYQGIKQYTFKENDEILILHLDKKIIFFKNFTQNLDNFNEIQTKQGLLLAFLFLVSIFFISLATIDQFKIIDLIFFIICIILLIVSFINANLLFKHINIFKNFFKEDVKEFLKKRKNAKA
ncbi:hypothetical protein [Campylobacter estrildidarum]|uniref:Uncharacterized protein n=1 Tax=Campylobacter estrildidarum TaxID=2510189 RepID=A0A4U7BMT4_9BACT|nr:hypothetical protein [Campylobacter estrildidarum]TKX31525.1 hypothetical protein CQA69_02595 [Campylobacter estrildidarum]